jgi:hypothetical protein
MMLYEKKSSLLNLSFKEAVFTSSDSRGVASRAIVNLSPLGMFLPYGNDAEP